MSSVSTFWKTLFSDWMQVTHIDPQMPLLQIGIEPTLGINPAIVHWMILALLFLLGLGIIIYRFPNKSRQGIDWLTRNLFWIALVVWFAGVWIYLVGLYDERLNILGIAPRAIIAAFGMFLASSELEGIAEAFRANGCYMAIFSCIHFAAVLISFLLLIKLTGFRLWAWLNLYSKSLCSHEEVYVFWGIHDESLLLAKSIRQREENSLIVFVNTNDIQETAQNQAMDMSNILDLISLRNQDIDNILQIKHAVLTNCHAELSTAHEQQGEAFFKALHTNRLGKIISRSKRIRFFLLSDEEEKNILSAVKLRHALTDMAESREITLYAHARKGRKNEIYDYYSLYDAASKEHTGASTQVVKIKLIDSSNLAITYLKQHFEHHPIHLVDIDPATATVTSPFHALIIGFGEVGRDAFRFLYEFGAFVSADGQRSPFHCHAIDADMAQIEGSYRATTTHIVDHHLSLIDTAIGTEQYYQTIDRIIEQLNYVIISIKDDDLALATAVDLYRWAMQRRNNDLKHFCIYVHCRESGHLKRMQEVADKLNLCNKASEGRMVIFGNKEELYTYDLIVDNKIEQEAKRYHKQYELTVPIFLSEEEEKKLSKEEQKELKEQKRAKIRATDVDTLWNKSFEAVGIKAGAGLGKIRDMIRMREQNIANTLHKKTKALLLGIKADDQEALEEWNKVIQTRKIGTTRYEGMDEKQPLLDNVARCEHIRWEASHRLMGYACDKEKNHIRKTHPDMRPMEELSEQTQSYDYNVLDTSLRLLLEEVKNK